MANFNYIAYLGQAHAPVQATTYPQQPSVQPSLQPSVQASIPSVSVQPSPHVLSSQKSSDLYLKVLSPDNKKEYRTVNLRGLCKETIDAPDMLKTAISKQCDGLNSENMDVLYFVQSKKVWINNRLDINDVWSIVDKGEKVTLWCLDTTACESQKRKRDELAKEESQPKKRISSYRGTSTSEERRSKAKENEEKLKELHKDKWTVFQYKLWAEALAYGTHTTFEEPPSASMFGRDQKRTSNNDAVVSGVMTAMNSLCQALIPKEKPDGQPMSSPMKKAQLRGMYIKQLNELRQLHDCQILSKEEYEEQRADLVKLMRELNERSSE